MKEDTSPAPQGQAARKSLPPELWSYTLRDARGAWLGQVVLTSDGMYASVTDWGDLSYAWRAFGSADFRDFILQLGPDYFSSKMALGVAYAAGSSQKNRAACDRYTMKILEPLKAAIRAQARTPSALESLVTAAKRVVADASDVTSDTMLSPACLAALNGAIAQAGGWSDEELAKLQALMDGVGAAPDSDLLEVTKPELIRLLMDFVDVQDGTTPQEKFSDFEAAKKRIDAFITERAGTKEGVR